MIDYAKVTPLAEFIVKAIAENPENRTADGVNWNFVSADVHMDYKGEFDDGMIDDAIDLIYEAIGQHLGPLH